MTNKFFSFIWYLIKDTVGDVGEFFKYVAKFLDLKTDEEGG